MYTLYFLFLRLSSQLASVLVLHYYILTRVSWLSSLLYECMDERWNQMNLMPSKIDWSFQGSCMHYLIIIIIFRVSAFAGVWSSRCHSHTWSLRITRRWPLVQASDGSVRTPLNRQRFYSYIIIRHLGLQYCGLSPRYVERRGMSPTLIQVDDSTRSGVALQLTIGS